MPLAEAPMAVLATAAAEPERVAPVPNQDRDGARLGLPVVAWGDVRAGSWPPAFCVGTVAADSGDGGRDLCVIAHRFGYALIYGAATLNWARCWATHAVTPLCQRIGAGHVKAVLARREPPPTWRGGPCRATPSGMPEGLEAGQGSYVT